MFYDESAENLTRGRAKRTPKSLSVWLRMAQCFAVVAATSILMLAPSAVSSAAPGQSPNTNFQSYRLVAGDGEVMAYGADSLGSAGGTHLDAPIVGMAATPDGDGYWLVAADGGIFTYGDAKFLGSAGGTHLDAPIVGMAATPDGDGYWLVAADGGIFTYGDAKFLGSAGGTHLDAPIVGMAATPDGDGYWLVAADGGIFTYGDAKFLGSAGGTHLDAPIVGMAATPDGDGYWLVAADGGIFTYGDAKFLGSAGGTHLDAPIVGMAATPDGDGYWLVAADGGIFTYGDAKFLGSAGGTHLDAPIVGMASNSASMNSSESGGAEKAPTSASTSTTTASPSTTSAPPALSEGPKAQAASSSPPTTTIIVPSNGTTLSGTSASLDAAASGANGVAITKVQFVITGGTYSKSVIGTATPTIYGYLYSWNTTTVPGGTYTLQSLATDASGTTAYSPGISVTVDNTPPTTAVVAPSTGADLSGTSATLDAAAAGANGVAIAKVQFVITGGTYTQSSIGTAAPSPYGYLYSWNTTTVPGGTYALQSLAMDAAGNIAYSVEISITVDNTPPTTTMIAPSNGATLSGTSASLDAGASGANGVAIAKVQFVITGGTYTQSVIGTAASSPYGYLYGWNTTTVPRGTYTLQSLATDAAGNTAYSAGISITVTNPPPTTTIIVPSNGTTLSGTSASLDAAASGANGVAITKVQFVITGGTYSKSVIGTATPTIYGYLYSWNTTTVPGGTYTLQSLATDASGTTAYSPGISVTVVPAPTVTSLSPTSGPTGGGTTVTISGTNLSGATAVKFGTVSATVTADGASSITATTPAESAATVDVTVTTPGGTSATSTSDKFTYQTNPPPTTTIIVPSNGTTLSGTSASLDAAASGANGVAITKVQFVITGGTYSKSVIGTATPTIYGYLYSWNTTTVPGGTYTLQSLATDASGTTAYSPGISVTVVPAPTVTSLSPTSGPTGGGTTVTISGTNLSGATAVKFGTVSATVTADGASSITATTPAESAATVDVTVTTPGGTSGTSTSDKFTYQTNPPPTTTIIVPSNGTTLSGTSASLDAAASGANGVAITKVQFVITGGTYSKSVIGTATPTIYGYLYSWNTTTVPGGTYTLQSLATDASGTTAYSPGISVTVVPAPTVTSLSPTSGPTGGGTTVTISGTNLSGATAVKFGTVSATVTADGASSITATTPAESAATVDVTVTTPGGTSATSTSDKFTYQTNPPPTTTIIVPSNGTTLSGTSASLDAAASGANGVAITKVQFVITGGTYSKSVIGTATPTIYGYLYSWNTTTVPGGTYTLQSLATDASGTTAYSPGISVTVVPAPTVTSLSPTSGPTGGGTTVTISGTNLSGATAVKFGTVSATVTADGASSITATTPAESAATVDVTVTTPGGTSGTSTSDKFTYQTNPPPTTTIIVPSNGTTLSGTSASLDAAASGANGVAITKVQFVITGGTYSKSVIGTATPTIYGYLYSWNTTTVPGGTYTLQSLATDASGTTAYSPGISVTVVNTGTCSNTWTGATGSDWSTGSNWSKGSVPGKSDNVCIPEGTPNLPVALNGSATISTLTNAGGLSVGGTLELTGSVSSSSGSLTVTGTLGGTAPLTVSGSLTLSRTLAGPGTVTVAAQGSLEVSSDASISGSLVNAGKGTVDANDGIAVDAGGSFVNAGSLDLNDGSFLLGLDGTPSSESQSGTTPAVPGGVLTNTGSITVTSAANFPASIGGCAPFVCTVGRGIDDKGSITVASGALNLSGGPLQTDSVDTGTVLYSPSTIDSGGSLSVPSGSSLNISGNAVVASGASLSATGAVTVSGTLTLNQNTTLPNLTVTGTLGGTAPLTVSGSLTLSRTLAGPGTVTVAAQGSLEVSSDASISGSLVNAGKGTVDANDGISVDAGGSFVNAGSLDLNDGSFLLGLDGTPSSESQSGTTPAVPGGVLTNTGSITVTSAANFPASIGGCAPFVCTVGRGIDDKGSITVASGALNLSGGPLQTDSVDTGTVLYSPSTIDSGGSLSVPSGSSLNISGNAVVASGASLSATGAVTVSGTLTLNQNTTLPNLTVTGTLGGTAPLTVSGSLTLSRTLAGPGTVTVAAQGSLEVSSDASISGSLVNAGKGTVDANDGISVDAGGSFVNAGSLDLNDGSFLLGLDGTPSSESQSGTTPAVPGGVLTNTGSITVTSAANFPASIGGCAPFVCTVSRGIDDKGSITVASGALNLSGGPLQTDSVDTGTVLYSPSTIDSGGSLSVPSGSSLNISGNAVVASGASLSATGAVTVSGTLTLNQNTTLPNLTVTGTLGGTAPLTVSGSLTLSRTLAGPGTVTVAAQGSLEVSSDASISGSLVNAGKGTVDANDGISVDAGGSFVNAGSLDLNDGSFLLGLDGTPSSESQSGTTPAVPGGVLTNTGSITVTSAANFPASIGGCAPFVCTVGRGIDDKGSITVASGALNLSGGPLQTDSVDTGTVLYSPSTIDSGGSLSVPSGSSLNISGNAVVASGASLSATGAVTVSGTLTLNQNTTLPNLTVTGTLELGSGIVAHTSNQWGSGTIELDASAPGQFGSLVVSGTVSISNVGLELNPSFSPGCGTAVTALTAGSVSGTWLGVSGPTPPEGTWEPAVGSTTAGGFIYCPPPPASLPLTFGSGSSYDAFNPSGYFAEPVNTATGAYSSTETDAKLAGSGIPFTFTRSYSSDVTASGPLGVGWTDSMNVAASDSGGNVTISDENGQQVTFTPGSGSTYLGPPGSTSTLSAVSGGGWLLVRHNQNHLTFNALGELISETDRNGVGLILSYNGSGQLSSVTDHAGHVVTFTYNASGLLASMTLPLSRSVTYAYNASSQLTSVTNAAGGVTSYAYNSAGLLATVTDQNGHEVSGQFVQRLGPGHEPGQRPGQDRHLQLRPRYEHDDLHRPQRKRLEGRLPGQRARRAHQPARGNDLVLL